MTIIAFEQIRPGDTIGYFHKQPGVKGRYWKNRLVDQVHDTHFILANRTKVYPENVVGDIKRLDPPFPWAVEDREGDTLHVSHSSNTVTLTIPGYGAMPFDIEDIEVLIAALQHAKTDAEVNGIEFEQCGTPVVGTAQRRTAIGMG